MQYTSRGGGGVLCLDQFVLDLEALVIAWLSSFQEDSELPSPAPQPDVSSMQQQISDVTLRTIKNRTFSPSPSSLFAY